MSILGFPNETELASMMGFVTDEDRQKWTQMKESSDKQLEGARSGMTARGLASHSAAPAISLAEKSINAQMQGEQIAEREAQRELRTPRFTKTERVEKTSYFENEMPPGNSRSDDTGMGF